MNSASLVVVTGSAGRIGQAAVAELARRGHRVRGFDARPSPGCSEAIVGNLLDRGALERAMQGATALVHLAATPDDVPRVLDDLFPANVAGLFHALEAARLAGVPRLVLASSGQMNWWRNQQGGPFPIGVDDPVTPKYWYAATKALLEAIGRGYHEMHGQSVVIGRLGWCPRTPEQVAEIAAADWAQDVYFSPRDAGRFFACAVEAPLAAGFAIVYATSRPVRTHRYDLEPARRLLGFEPQEQRPTGIEVVG